MPSLSSNVRIGSMLLVGVLTAHQAAAQSFQAGAPLGTTNEAGEARAISDNVKVYGSFVGAESCTFDPGRNLILAMSQGLSEQLQQNDGFVSLIHPDGSVHTFP